MEKIKNSLKNLSLRKSLVLYIILFAVIALALSVGITQGCRMAEEQIHASYPQTEERYYLTNEAGERLGEGGLIGKEDILYTVQDKRNLQAISLIQTLAVPLSFSLCMLAAVFVFL